MKTVAFVFLAMLLTGQVLAELSYGVNAKEIRLVVDDDFTFVLGRARRAGSAARGNAG